MTDTEIRQALANNKSVYWGYKVPAWGTPDYTVTRIEGADKDNKIPITVFDSRWQRHFTLHYPQAELANGSEDFYTLSYSIVQRIFE